MTLGSTGSTSLNGGDSHNTPKDNQVIFFPLPGCKNKNHGALLKELMQTNNFRVTVVEEYDVVEICGALKVSFYNKTQLHAGKVGFLCVTSYIESPS